MKSVLKTLMANGLSVEGIEESSQLTQEPIEQPQIETEQIDGVDLSELTQAEQELETLSEVSAVEQSETAEAVKAATKLDELQTSLESLCQTRLPTEFELNLIRKVATETTAFAKIDFCSRGVESGDIGSALTMTQEDLKSAASTIWSAIGKALEKLVESLKKTWKAFVFWLKPAQSQITQFKRELEKFEGELKFDQLQLKPKNAAYTGLGEERNPAEVIKQLETANRYVISDVFAQMAQFASKGSPVPKISDDVFLGLPNEPRFRVSPDAAHFIEQPAHPTKLNILVPSVETMKEWCQAFLDEALYYIHNYESFKSTAEKIYDAIHDSVDPDENPNADGALEVGSKILFARSHSCVEAMEDWAWYTIRVMQSHHAILLQLRKAFI